MSLAPLKQLSCPNCGQALEQRLESAKTIVCPSCDNHISVGKEEAEVLSGGSKLPAPAVPVYIGDTATIDGEEYFVLGRVVYRGWEPDDPSDRWHWTEWLLGAPSGKMVWLSFYSETGFTIYERMRIRKPFDAETDRRIPVGRGEESFAVDARYPARIIGAEGELTFEAKTGERLLVVEGQLNGKSYSIQKTPTELEMYEGDMKTPHEIADAFQRPEIIDAVKGGLSPATTRRGYVWLAVAALGLLMSLGSCVLSGAAGNSGNIIAQQPVNLNSERRAIAFPVAVNSTRPARLELASTSSSQMVVDVTVKRPNNQNLVVLTHDFRGGDNDASIEFVPRETGQHNIEVGFDQSITTPSQFQARVEVYTNALNPNCFVSYACIGGILAIFMLLYGIMILFSK